MSLRNQDLSGCQNMIALSWEKIEKMGYWGFLPEWKKVNKELSSPKQSSVKPAFET